MINMWCPGEADGMLHAQIIFKHSGNSLFCVVTGNNLVGLFDHKQGASAADLKQRKSKQIRKRNHRSTTAETLFHQCWVFYKLLNTFYIRLRLTDQSAEFCKISNYHFVACKRRVWQGSGTFLSRIHASVTQSTTSYRWQMTKRFHFHISDWRTRGGRQMRSQETNSSSKLDTVTYPTEETRNTSREIRRQALMLNETFPRNPATM